MPKRHGGNADRHLLPEDALKWAKKTWADRDAVCGLPGGLWMLREAARLLNIPSEEVSAFITLKLHGEGPKTLN
jgi:hypothetical protein